ncbi:hypothetical protein [Paenibacillus etheri]|nr:hypothetical protein [Paenibacillus etheri]
MKSLNEQATLWSDVTVEAMEIRDEYAWCFDCFCLKIDISCVSFGCIF